MFVDACAIISMIMREGEAEAYRSALVQAAQPFTSSLAAWEAAIVLARPDKLDCGYAASAAVILDWLDVHDIALKEAMTSRDVLIHAAVVAEQHGLGNRALSNFDCFHYAHAKAAGVPLLTLDRLLQKTDVTTVP